MITVTLYSRPDCHLCEQAKADLELINKEFPHRLVVVNVDSTPELREEYGFDVPVVEIGPYKMHPPFSQEELRLTLRAASDRQEQLERIDSPAYQAAVKRSQSMSRVDRFSCWFSRHYMAVINLLLFLYVGLPFLAPVFMEFGWTPAAEAINKIYQPLCHQWGFRSWYLFGEQAFYPHEAAGMEGLVTFEQATGITDANDPLRVAARQYTGDSEVGYKVPLCERDVAIWGSILLFGLVFALTGRRIPSLHWLAWFLIGLVPVGLDGFSQIISQMPVESIQSVLPYRESTPLLRTLTGFLFGFSTAWFGFPVLEEAMRETRRFFAKKTAVVQSD